MITMVWCRVSDFSSSHGYFLDGGALVFYCVAVSSLMDLIHFSFGSFDAGFFFGSFYFDVGPCPDDPFAFHSDSFAFVYGLNS
jgi:hypothetical protein